MNLKILNKKEIKKILEKLNNQFGFEGELDYVFLLNNKDRIYLMTKDLAKIKIDSLRINSMGLYFAELPRDEIRLSIEGSQLVGKHCNKNILELTQKEGKDWLKGFDLARKEEKGFYLLKHEDDFLGCGRAVDDKILNFVPKNRRLKVSD